jgi:hypothetical protein
VNLWEQIPYAISGGMLGLALVFAGGFCYFAYWLTQLVYAARRDNADTRILLEHIEQLLSSGASLSALPAVDGALNAGGRQLTATAPAAATATFFATPTGTMFHRATCPAVAGRDNLREVHGDEDGLTPCKICEPLAT